MSKSTTCRDQDDACCKKRKVFLDGDDDEKCALHRNIVTADDFVKEPVCDQVYTEPIQGSTASEANQLDPFVREWDRAVGLRLDNAVVLAAHRLSLMKIATDITLICAMTGDIPVSADKAVPGLTVKIKELIENGIPKLTVDKVAEFVPQFCKQTGNVDFVAFLLAGRDWDASRQTFVPCLTYANKRSSWNPESYCTGLGSLYSKAIVNTLYSKNMSIEEAIDVALHALYFAALCHKVEGKAVLEAIDVCVVTAEGMTTSHYGVENLHKTYGPLVEERMKKLVPPPSWKKPVVRFEDEEDDEEDMEF